MKLTILANAFTAIVNGVLWYLIGSSLNAFACGVAVAATVACVLWEMRR